MEGYRQSLTARICEKKLTLVGRDDGCVSSKREMDSGEGHQIGLELVQIDVQGTVKSKRCGNGRDDLGDETVEVSEGRRSDAKVSSTDIVDTAVNAILSRVLTPRCQP